MSMRHDVDAQGRYDGRTLQELWPVVVAEIVREVQPLEVILFGSVARGEDGPDSDIDVLVVLDQLAAEEKRPMMARIRSAIHTFAPVDVLVTRSGRDRRPPGRRRLDVVLAAAGRPHGVQPAQCPSELTPTPGSGSRSRTSLRPGCC